jgi:hypothetical protein
MRRIFLGLSIAALASTACLAEAERSHAYDDFIAQQAKKHGVPESLVHRILRRESRYDPKVFHNHCYGLMQIKYGTAQSMGYHGAPKGLFDPYVNMTYAIPYLANAYRVADGDEDRAVSFFAAGYYYAAKKKQLLAALRTADSPPLAPEPASLPAPAPPHNPMADLFAFLQSPAQNPVHPTQVQVAQGQVPEAAPPPVTDAAAPGTAAAPPPAETVAQANPAPSGQGQAVAEPPAQDATASISTQRPQAADAKSHKDKAASPKAAHNLAKTKIALVEKASAAPETAKAAQPSHRAKEAKAHAIATAAANPATDAAPATGSDPVAHDAAPAEKTAPGAAR